jgi:protein-disulfide isomerase
MGAEINMAPERNSLRKRGINIAGAAGWILMAAVLSATGQGSAGKPEELCLGGQPNAPVRIEVFSDFECPHCREFYLDTLKPLIADFTKEKRIDKIYILYHDFPLDMHPNARKAASYALAAKQISREAWLRVIDVLYQDQELWSQNGNIEGELSKVLNPAELARVRKLVTDPSIEQAVRLEVQLGQSREITMTPTFFIISQSGRQQRVNGSLGYLIVKDSLEQLLK